MSNAKFVGRIGAMAAALEVGNVRRIATRMTVSIGVAAVVVVATVVPASASTAEPAGEPPLPDKTALIMCGTTCPTPNQFWIDAIGNKYIEPTHPGQIADYKPVTAPMEFWPITGLFRIVLLAIGPQELWGPGGPGWPDEPLWKLSGLFDRTANQSLADGVTALEAVMAENGNDHLVIYGNSQGAGIANVVKKKLAEQYPKTTAPDTAAPDTAAPNSEAPDIDFVLGGDPNLPNGGLMSRFPGLYIPIVNLTFNGPAATDTLFDTVEINRQYDGFSDFPLYPLNFIADLNAVLGVFYVHAYGLDVSLPANPKKNSPAYQYTHGDTDYYFFETQDLPLFGPLRTLGVPEPLIDVVEPFVREIVELGYDRSIPAWQPTPARLIPSLDPATVATDLVNAIGEGINNAAALFDAPAPLSRRAAPASAGEGAVESQPPAEAAVTLDIVEAGQPTLGRQLAATRDHIHDTVTAVKSAVEKGHTFARSTDNATASPTRKTPLRDAAARARADVKKVVTTVRDGVKKTFAAARDKDNARPKRGAVAAP